MTPTLNPSAASQSKAVKDIRLFVASSKELLPECNYLVYLALAYEGEFERRGFRVRLLKWEYVDPKMTVERTEETSTRCTTAMRQ